MVPTIIFELKSFRLFIGSQKKMKHIIEEPPIKGIATYDDWVASDYSVMTWLLNGMDENINASVMFLKIVKEIWNTLKEMYSDE